MSIEEALLKNWWVYPGFELELVTTGFDLPVNIAFVSNLKDDPKAPLLYVTELYGTVKVLTNDGTVQTYAEGLLNFDPSHEFPGSGESGLTGICVEPETGDLFLSMIYLDNGGAVKGKVVRTSSTDGGLTMDSMNVVIDNIPSTNRAHQVQAVSIGFDGKLYVNVADGGEWEKAQDDNDLRGKILRMDQDGTIPWDNPNPQRYVFAKGFRNPFGAAWRKSDQSLYIAGNGPDVDDRIARVRPFENYGWPGTMRKNSIFWWHHTQAPTAIDFMQDGQFPPQFNDDLFVALFGASYAKGRGEKGKKIVKLHINDDCTGIKSYDEFVVYQGSGAASPCGLAFGPDGLYFTDLHGEKDGVSQVAGGNMYRVIPSKEQVGDLKEREKTYGKRWASFRKE